MTSINQARVRRALDWIAFKQTSDAAAFVAMRDPFLAVMTEEECPSHNRKRCDPELVAQKILSELQADPDSIISAFPCGCPSCGSQALEALTWDSIGSALVTSGCWNCDWAIYPPDYTPPEA